MGERLLSLVIAISLGFQREAHPHIVEPQPRNHPRESRHLREPIAMTPGPDSGPGRTWWQMRRLRLLRRRRRRATLQALLAATA